MGLRSHHGIAIVKALVLGKFILVLHALKIGERMGSARVLLADILKRSVLFVVFLIALTVVEEIIVGYFHGLKRNGRRHAATDLRRKHADAVDPHSVFYVPWRC